MRHTRQRNEPPSADELFKAHPIDTSTLGPIKIDRDARAVQVRIVREALEAVSRYEGDDVHKAFTFIIRYASDETLDKLRRMLKG